MDGLQQSNQNLYWMIAHYALTVGMPRVRSPPSFFGMATVLTGDGKYVPDDMRFQIL